MDYQDLYMNYSWSMEIDALNAAFNTCVEPMLKTTCVIHPLVLQPYLSVAEEYRQVKLSKQDSVVDK